MGKRGLIRAVAQAGAKGVDVGRDSLDVLKNTVRHFYEYISALFDYYAVLGDGFHFAIRSNAFNDFVRVSRLTEEPTGNERKGSIVLDMHQFEIIWTSCIFQDAATKKEGLNMEGCVSPHAPAATGSLRVVCSHTHGGYPAPPAAGSRSCPGK